MIEKILDEWNSDFLSTCEALHNMRRMGYDHDDSCDMLRSRNRDKYDNECESQGVDE